MPNRGPGPETTTELVPHLAPALTPRDRVDPELVSRVIGEVERLHAPRGVPAMRAIGTLLLERFYDGDVCLLVSLGRRHASLLALLGDDRLRISGTQLWYALHLLPHLRELGQPLADALPMSHHRLLIHVHNPEVKRELALRATSMSKRELEAAVRARKGGPKASAGRGGPRRPAEEQRERTSRAPRPHMPMNRAPIDPEPDWASQQRPGVNAAEGRTVDSLLADIVRLGELLAPAIRRFVAAPASVPLMDPELLLEAESALDEIDMFVGALVDASTETESCEPLTAARGRVAG